MVVGRVGMGETPLVVVMGVGVGLVGRGDVMSPSEAVARSGVAWLRCLWKGDCSERGILDGSVGSSASRLLLLEAWRRWGVVCCGGGLSARVGAGDAAMLLAALCWY